MALARALPLGAGGRASRAASRLRAELLDPVAERRGPLEFQLLGGLQHLGLEGCQEFLVASVDLVAADRLADHLAGLDLLLDARGGSP